MKAVLKISLLVNLGLSGFLIFTLTNQRTKTAAALPSETNTGIFTPVEVVAASPIVRRARPQPFNWSQLESTNDYEVYVANLRAIGCPEPTIQDIVRGDAERGFSFERSLLGLDGSGTGKWSRLQQAQTVARLLGEPIPVAETAATARSAENRTQPNGEIAVSQSSSRTQGLEQASETIVGTQNVSQKPLHRAAVSAPAYPLVFQNANMENLGLNGNQKAAIQQLQKQFVNDLGGSDQNPSDPSYLANWQNAENNSDKMLLIDVGWQVYSQYQIMAWQNSLK